jgi:hypothetical protein
MCQRRLHAGDRRRLGQLRQLRWDVGDDRVGFIDDELIDELQLLGRRDVDRIDIFR